MPASDEWAILQDLCGDDPMYLELIAKLLDIDLAAFQQAWGRLKFGQPAQTEYD